MVKTFQSVFPHTTIWYANGDIFMIGSPSKLSIDYERMMRGLLRPNIKELLTEIDLEDPVEFLTTFIMNEDQVRAYAQSADVMTDDMPVVEFTGPRSLNYNTISPNIAEFLKYREPVATYVTVTPDKDYSEFEKRLAIRFEADGGAAHRPHRQEQPPLQKEPRVLTQDTTDIASVLEEEVDNFLHVEEAYQL